MNKVTSLQELIQMIVARDHATEKNVMERCQHCMQELSTVSDTTTKLKIMKFWLNVENEDYLVFLEGVQ